MSLRAERNVLRADELAELGDGDFDFLVVIHQGDVESVAGFGIEGFTLLQLLTDKKYQLLWGLALQQGALGLAYEQVVVEHLRRTVEVDDLTLIVHIVHVVEEARCATAAAQHDVLELSYFVEHVVLYLPEPFLAAFCKNLRNLLAHPVLYVPVKVVELKAEFFGKGAANGCLARAHVSYENDSLHFQLLTLLIISMHSS